MALTKKLRDRSKGQWFWINNALVRGFPALDIFARHTYTVLCYHANNEAQAAKIYLGALAQQVGCSVSKLRKALASLQAEGLVRYEATAGRGRANTFYLVAVDAKKVHEVEVFEEENPHGEGVLGAENPHVVRPFNKTSTKTVKTSTEEGPVGPPSGATGAPPANSGGNGPGPGDAAHVGGPTPERVAHLLGGRERKVITDEIHRLHMAASGGVPPPWPDLAFARLRALLDKSPTWTVAQWVTCVRNYYATEGVNALEWPQNFIPYLTRYAAGPLDRYGKVKGGSNGTVNARTARNREALAEANRLVDAAAAGHGPA